MELVICPENLPNMRITTLIASRIFLISVIFVLLLIIAFLLNALLDGTQFSSPYQSRHQSAPQSGAPEHTLAVVVPYRDRFEELLIFVPYLARFLSAQNVSHRIFIVNQVDAFRFNRASLINVGFLYAVNSSCCDYMAMHDVDLLPLNAQLSYAHPGQQALYHVAAPQYHPRYHYQRFVGGILIVTMPQFWLMNGMSNNYWGWGLEDDEFYTRISAAKLDIHRPANLSTNSTNTFRHIHNRRVRRRDMEQCFNQRQVTHRRDRVTGVFSVEYRLVGVSQLTVNGAAAEVLSVQLMCDQQRTPWCDCRHGNDTSQASSSGRHDNQPTTTRKVASAGGKNVLHTKTAGDTQVRN